MRENPLRHGGACRWAAGDLEHRRREDRGNTRVVFLQPSVGGVLPWVDGIDPAVIDLPLFGWRQVRSARIAKTKHGLG